MIDLDKLAEDWPSPFVARIRIEEFTKGMYKSSTIKIYDSLGTGIIPRYRFGMKIFYKTSDVVNWIKQRKMEQE